MGSMQSKNIHDNPGPVSLFFFFRLYQSSSDGEERGGGGVVPGSFQ